MVRASASRFITATISTSPEAWSVVTHGISPWASNFGASSSPSSTCSMETRAPKGDDGAGEADADTG